MIQITLICRKINSPRCLTHLNTLNVYIPMTMTSWVKGHWHLTPYPWPLTRDTLALTLTPYRWPLTSRSRVRDQGQWSWVKVTDQVSRTGVTAQGSRVTGPGTRVSGHVSGITDHWSEVKGHWSEVKSHWSVTLDPLPMTSDPLALTSTPYPWPLS